jgi:hypothetical protein
MRKGKTEGGKIKNIFQKYKMLFLLVAVIAVSGCVIPGGDVFQGMFAPQRPATVEDSPDLITVQNTNVIPSPPISADNGFTVSFEVKNNDEKEEVKNVGVTNYDWGLCTSGKAPPTGGGGIGGLIDNEIDIRVAHFSTTCSGKTTDIHLADRNDQNNAAGYQFSANDQILCDDKDCETAGCQVTVIDKDKVWLKIGSLSEIEFITSDPTKSYDGKTITFSGVTTVTKSRCVSSATSCARTSSDADTVCKKLGATYFVSDISGLTGCYPWYGNSGFDGYCFKCDYTSGGGDGVSPPVAGAKTYLPLQTELFENGFTAPSNKDIGNMPSSCRLRYKITYTYTAKTQTDVTVISQSKLEELQRAGQPPSASPLQSVGAGPVKIYFDFGASQPIMSGNILPLFITIEDKGSGVIDRGKVLSGKLKITMPPGFTVKTCDRFAGTSGAIQNTAEIPLIKKKSAQMRCSFTTPSVTDMKTFYILGELQYDYKLDNEINVAVKPTLVR